MEQTIRIMKLGINGEGIGYVNQKPVFVPLAHIDEEVVVGDLVDHKTYFTGTMMSVVKASPSRIPSKCVIQKACGGCPLLTLRYPTQLQQKHDLFAQTLYKYCGIKSSMIDPIVANPSPLGYRNQFKLPVQMVNGKLACGMYQANTNRMIAMQQCLIHDQDLEQIRIKIVDVLNSVAYQAYDPDRRKGLRYLVVRGFERKYQVTLVTGKERLSDTLVTLLKEIPGVVSVYQSINDQRHGVELFGAKLEHVTGVKKLGFKFMGLQLYLYPQAFMQLNLAQAQNIYQRVLNHLDNNDQSVVEAYCGIGVMALLMAKTGRQVTGIELSVQALKSAKENARMNHLESVEWILGDAAAALENIVKSGKPDVLVVDPPRSGLSEAMIKQVMAAKVNKVIYVSCNPSTLSKDLQVLMQQYTIKQITPFDMFSQSGLIESVTVLVKK